MSEGKLLILFVLMLAAIVFASLGLEVHQLMVHLGHLFDGITAG